MDLFTAAAIVSLGIGISCLIPHYSAWVRGHAKVLLFIGTLILLGFVLFDLVPEMMEIGGPIALLLIGTSWAVFTAIHGFGSGGKGTHHEHLHDHLDAKKHHSVGFLLGSMAVHCFAGGMLLVSSYSVSAKLAWSVFLSLVAHKAFEAISLSSLLIERVHTRRHLYTCVAVYALSFPLGVAVTAGLTQLFAHELSPDSLERIAMVITSIAVGSLFGCLLQDFLLPSLREFRRTTLKAGSV